MAAGTETAPPCKRVRHSLDDGPSVESAPISILVGETKQKFFVHETLLCANSGFFERALRKEWKERRDAVVNLPCAEPEQFAIWVKFLYTGRIYIGRDSMEETQDLISGTSLEVGIWETLYILGDFLQDTDFGDALIDAMVDWMTVTGKAPVLLPTFVYSNSKLSSAHRTFAVDIYINPSGHDRFEEDFGFSREFLCDVLKAIGPKLRTGIKGVAPKVWFKHSDACKYHDHGDKPCYKTKPAFHF